MWPGVHQPGKWRRVRLASYCSKHDNVPVQQDSMRRPM